MCCYATVAEPCESVCIDEVSSTHGTQPSHIHCDKWTVDCKLAYSIQDTLCTKCTPFVPFSMKAVIKRLWCINQKGLC